MYQRFEQQKNKLCQLLADAKTSTSPLTFAVSGSGLTAVNIVRGGIPFLMALNAGIYRMAGVPSHLAFMPCGNANEQVENLIRTQIIPRCPETPLVAGVLINDPSLPLTKRLERLQELGVAGVINWPPVSINRGKFLDSMRKRGFCEEQECSMLKLAKSIGFVTMGFVSTKEAAKTLAYADVDAMIINLGWTLNEVEPMEKNDLIQYAIQHTNSIIDTIHNTVQKEPVYFFYGGSITTPHDILKIYQRTKVDGYGAGSAFEYYPVRDLLQSISRTFLSIQKNKPLSSHDIIDYPNFVGSSHIMVELYNFICRTSSYPVNVCIEGESGVGKEVVANMIHSLSKRSTQPFITINCGAITESLIESELFGHERGSFTGAIDKRIGKFELANGGTLFLDEVGELSQKAQVCLLRAIQQQEIIRIGGKRSIHVDVRIICATNRNLRDMVNKGLFRTDLFYRLNTITISVPPLRERLEDIPILSEYFLKKYQSKLGCGPKTISTFFLKKLKQHSWPGNVRELQHALMEAAILEDGDILMGYSFTPDMCISQPNESKNENPINNSSNLHDKINEALQRAGGNKAKAARYLGISRKTLYVWLSKQNKLEEKIIEGGTDLPRLYV